MTDTIILRKMQPIDTKDKYYSLRMIYPLSFLNEKDRAQIEAGKTPYVLLAHLGDTVVMQVLVSEDEEKLKAARLELAQNMIDSISKELKTSSVRLLPSLSATSEPKVDCSGLITRVKNEINAAREVVGNVMATSESVVKKYSAEKELLPDAKLKLAKSKDFIGIAKAFLLFLQQIEDATKEA